MVHVRLSLLRSLVYVLYITSDSRDLMPHISTLCIKAELIAWRYARRLILPVRICAHLCDHGADRSVRAIMYG